MPKLKKDPNSRYQQRLGEEGLTARHLRDSIAASLPEPKVIPLGRNTFVSSEVQVRLANGIDGAWISSLPEVKERMIDDYKTRLFRLAQTIAEEDGQPWTAVLSRLADALSAEQREVDRNKGEGQNLLKDAQKALDRARTNRKEAPAPNVLSHVTYLFNSVKDTSEQVNAINQLEEASFRVDVQTIEQDVLSAGKGSVLDTIEPCDQLQSKLEMAERGSELEDFTDDGSTALQMPGIGWEPVGDLARILTDSESRPALPRDLLYHVSQGVELAQERLDEQTIAEAHRQPMTLRLKAALEKTHGADLKEAGREIILGMNEGAGRDPLLFQLVERGPDGQTPAIWPSLPQETDILAPEGPAFILGFLRIDGAEEVDAFLGAGLPSVGLANAYCNLDLATRFAVPDLKDRAS